VSDSEELIYLAEYSEDSDFDREFTGDNFEEFSIPVEVIPVIAEFIDVSHKDTLTPPEVTSVIIESTDISPKGSTLISLKLIHVLRGLLKFFMKTSQTDYNRCVISNTSLI